MTVADSEVLVVDDTEDNLVLLSGILRSQGYRVRTISNPEAALPSAISDPPHLILLDVRMPVLDGFEVCRRLKNEESTQKIPVIFVSALTELEDHVTGFEAGGVDFINKPIQAEELLARVRTHLDLYRMREHLEQLVSERTAERVQAEEQLRQSQKMEALGQLTGGIAHDFNNVLAVILGNLELAGMNLDRGKPLRENIDTATNATLRGAELTHRLLAFARKQTLDVKTIDLRSLVQGMNDMLRRSLGETVDLEIVSDAGLWLCAADPSQVEQALLNLAINARDAMPGGGKLTIEASNVRITDEYAASCGEVTPGQYVLLAVSDTGTGMPPDVKKQIFQPYFTTKAIGKGTGLGLSMVFGFVKQSNGHISVYSEEGCGTTFKIYLPRSDGAATQYPLSSASADTRARPGEIVLLVEDDGDVRAAVSQMLEAIGYGVLEAGDGGAALEILTTAPRIDLLLSDVVLPGEPRGRRLREAALELKPDLKIIFMSGYTDSAIVHHGRLDPDVELLSKPFTKDNLARKLRRALGHGA